MLVATPKLQSDILSLTNTFLNKLFGAGPDLTESNFKSDPAQRQQACCEQFANDLSEALDSYINSIIFQVQIGTLTTAGGPTTQINVSPGVITKL